MTILPVYIQKQNYDMNIHWPLIFANDLILFGVLDSNCVAVEIQDRHEFMVKWIFEIGSLNSMERIVFLFFFILLWITFPHYWISVEWKIKNISIKLNTWRYFFKIKYNSKNPHAIESEISVYSLVYTPPTRLPQIIIQWYAVYSLFWNFAFKVTIFIAWTKVKSHWSLSTRYHATDNPNTHFIWRNSLFFFFIIIFRVKKQFRKKRSEMNRMSDIISFLDTNFVDTPIKIYR